MNNKLAIKVRELAIPLNNFFFKEKTFFRYIVAGLIGASTNVGFLFVFTHFFKVWYIFSSIIAFVIAVFVSFTLQKFWAFADRQMERVKRQFGFFVFTALIGLCINSVLMYIFVEHFELWYILAQLITNVFIATFNFFMYKFFVFKKN